MNNLNTKQGIRAALRGIPSGRRLGWDGSIRIVGESDFLSDGVSQLRASHLSQHARAMLAKAPDLWRIRNIPADTVQKTWDDICAHGNGQSVCKIEHKTRLAAVLTDGSGASIGVRPNRLAFLCRILRPDLLVIAKSYVVPVLLLRRDGAAVGVLVGLQPGTY